MEQVDSIMFKIVWVLIAIKTTRCKQGKTRQGHTWIMKNVIDQKELSSN